MPGRSAGSLDSLSARELNWKVPHVGETCALRGLGPDPTCQAIPAAGRELNAAAMPCWTVCCADPAATGDPHAGLTVSTAIFGVALYIRQMPPLTGFDGILTRR